MKLIDELIAALSDESQNLVGALLKTKILLHKIGKQDLVDWVNNELNGYSAASAVPAYRVLKTQILGDISDGYYQKSAHPIPTGHLQQSFKNYPVRQGLGAIESLLQSEGERLAVPISMEANGRLSEGLANGFQVQRAWSQVQFADVKQITTQVRSRLLDFVLYLNEALPGNLTDAEIETRAASTDAENIFNNAIFGNNTTIIIGNGNTQKVTATIIKGDFNTLSETLRHQGVNDSDINNLKSAINDDALAPVHEPNTFGVSVKSWIKEMMSKAVDASWQVELGVAGSLLASALQRYYGWP
ncbi:response regulator receiver protein [Candidatus Electronema sp. PJ]|uniref:AbiTii domain-containing protein n=1 Tax=Candidatus Electronema sp. PJ TaxID=3401572 RepID=UPI003AA9674C